LIARRPSTRFLPWILDRFIKDLLHWDACFVNVGTNLEQAKDYNRRVIFNAVRQHGPTTRAELARMTGLTAQTISSITAALREQGLIRLGERRKGFRGQPAVEIEVDPDGACAVGLNLDRDSMTMALVDLSGTVRERLTRKLDYPTPDQACDLVRGELDRLLAPLGPLRERILGMGVAFPGRFRRGEEGIHAPANFTAWHGLDVSALLSEVTGLETWVENDGNAAALGELLYGAGRGWNSFFLLYIGAGVGGGLIVNGQPFRGASRNVAEASRLPLPTGTKEFSAGGRLTHVVSMYNLTRRLQAAGLSVEGPESLTALFRQGEPELLNWLDEGAEALGFALTSVQFLLDPDAIVLGGRLPDILLDELLARTRWHLEGWFNGQPNPPRLVKSRLAGDATVLGAAALPLHARLAPSPETVWIKTGAAAS